MRTVVISLVSAAASGFLVAGILMPRCGIRNEMIDECREVVNHLASLPPEGQEEIKKWRAKNPLADERLRIAEAIAAVKKVGE